MRLPRLDTVLNWLVQARSNMRTILTTKWGVASAVGAALLWRRDTFILLYLAGAAVATLSAKILKLVLLQARPVRTKICEPHGKHDQLKGLDVSIERSHQQNSVPQNCNRRPPNSIRSVESAPHTAVPVRSGQWIRSRQSSKHDHETRKSVSGTTAR